MNTIVNPSVPFSMPIPGGVHPGKMIKLQGFTPYVSNRFAINLLCGPMGDVALHVCPKFDQKCVMRNSIQNMQMGYEESSGLMPIHPGQSFEVLILCDPQNFKIAFNGQHFSDFNHRLPYSSITNLAVDGQVIVYSISFEQNSHTNGNTGFVVPPNLGFSTGAGQGAPQYPAAPVNIPYSINNNAPNAAGSPYPHNNPVYPPNAGYGHQISAAYPQPYINYPRSNPQNGSSAQPSAYEGENPLSSKSHKTTGLLDKAGMTVAGVLGATTLLGGKKALKKQMKAHKKALKYGLPLAGVGIGAYAMHKGFHGFRRSSSSSSSSSD